MELFISCDRQETAEDDSKEADSRAAHAAGQGRLTSDEGRGQLLQLIPRELSVVEAHHRWRQRGHIRVILEVARKFSMCDANKHTNQQANRQAKNRPYNEPRRQ